MDEQQREFWMFPIPPEKISRLALKLGGLQVPQGTAMAKATIDRLTLSSGERI
jgi:hypothetical protein